jgi:hypothetical protein
MSNYDKQWSSANPGLLIIMIDQSGSMDGEYQYNESKAVFASKAVNNTIKRIIDRNFSGGSPKDRCSIVVFGYGQNAGLLTEGFLSDLAASPLRVETVKKKISDDGIETDVQMPVYVEPKASGQTNMTEAFKLAKDLIEKFIAAAPDCPAPVVINISDGAPYVGYDYDFDAAETAAKSIMNLSCEDGSPLIFNAHIEKGSVKIKLPTSKDKLSDKNEQFLFEISSLIPEAFRPAAEKNGLAVEPNARGCMIGVEAEDLVKLIDFGSSKGLEDPIRA